MRKKKSLIITCSVILLALFFTFIHFYLKSVNFCQPLDITISGISKENTSCIKMNAVTPLNRILAIQYDDSVKAWQTHDNTFLKKIEIYISDTIESKVDAIVVSSEEQKSTFNLKDLLAVDISGHIHEYHLPVVAGNEPTPGKLLPLIMRWPETAIFIKILLLITALLLAVLFVIRIKKGKRSIVASPENKTAVNKKRLQDLILWMKIVGFSTLTACIIFFGYLFFKFSLVTYITAVLFILLSCLLIWLLIYIILKSFRAGPVAIKRAKIACLILMLLWFCTETSLRIAKLNISKNERDGLYYTSGYKVNIDYDKKNPHLLVHPPNESQTLKYPEFKYEMRYNSDGLRDTDHPVEKDTNEYRIICIGDSFTEGIGTPQDSTWPKLLQDRLKRLTSKKITVFNAGKSGSDPFFGYMLLTERMLKYKPDLVLLTIGFNATNFYLMRGGFERFTSDGYHFREAPVWEQIYALSYICRFISTNILHYYYFLSPDNYRSEQEKGVKAIDSCIEKFYALSQKEHFKLVLLYFDTNESLSLFDGWTSPYTNIMQNTKEKNIIPYIYMNDYIHDIEKISSDSLNSSYFWPINRHCNSKGYLLMARGIEWQIKKMGIIDSLNNH